jgi:membrane protein YdbS with pleckstrin-like domain
VFKIIDNENQSALFEVRPVFRRGSALLTAILVAFLGTAFLGSFLTPLLIALGGGLLISLNIDFIERAIETADPETIMMYIVWAPVAVVILLFLLIAWFMYSREKRLSKKVVYTFYSDRLVYTEAYGSKKFTVTYQNIVGVDLTCSPSQERKGLGSIYISTANNTKKIRINNIANPQEVYYSIQKLIPRRQPYNWFNNPWSGEEDFKNVN